MDLAEGGKVTGKSCGVTDKISGHRLGESIEHGQAVESHTDILLALLMPSKVGTSTASASGTPHAQFSDARAQLEHGKGPLLPSGLESRGGENLS